MAASRSRHSNTVRDIVAISIAVFLILSHMNVGGCEACTEVRKLISGVEDRFLKASSHLEISRAFGTITDTYLAEDARILEDRDKEGTNLAWCSTNLYSNSENPWFEVEFGADVTILRLEIGGIEIRRGCGLNLDYDFYIKRFRIRYADANGVLKPISTTDGNEEFTRRFTTDVREINFDAITTRRLQIEVLDWKRNCYSTYNYPCIKIEARGCLAEDPTQGTSSLLSDDDTGLLPPNEIRAENVMTTTSVSNVVDEDENKAWCFEANLNENPFVEFTFTEDVWLTHMITRGSLIGGDPPNFGFVTKFSVQYRSEGMDGFNTYIEPELSESNHIFQTSTGFERTLTFWTPIRGKVFRFKIIDGQASLTSDTPAYCWNIQLYGSTDIQVVALAAVAEGALGDDHTINTVGVFIGGVLGILTLSGFVTLVVIAVIKRTRRQHDRNELTTSKEHNRRSPSPTPMLESIAYTWARNGRIDASTVTENTTVQTEIEIQSPPVNSKNTLMEPLLASETEANEESHQEQ